MTTKTLTIGEINARLQEIAIKTALLRAEQKELEEHLMLPVFADTLNALKKDGKMPLLIEKAMRFAFDSHFEVNQRYGKKHPYSYHLLKAVRFGVKYLGLIPEPDREIVIAALFGHDLIEDCRLTLNDVRDVLGERVAEIIYAVTNEKGKNRKERANQKYYDGIKLTPYAEFVKLCDRLANVEHSRGAGDSMLKKYQKEHSEFTEALFQKKTLYIIMWEELFGLIYSD